MERRIAGSAAMRRLPYRLGELGAATMATVGAAQLLGGGAYLALAFLALLTLAGL